MTGAAEILVVAFAAQLAVLPGEKVQFIIAALSTRYRPVVVVSAAATAFAGWTALEVAFGGLLQDLLPGAALDAITAFLFLGFGVALLRAGRVDPSAVTEGLVDAADGFTVPWLGVTIPARSNGFLPIFAMMAAGEVGDKTQLVTIGLAAQYGAHPAIWAGEMLAIVPVSALNAFVFHRFSAGTSVRRARIVGAAVFLFFGVDILLARLVGVSVWGTMLHAVSGILGASIP